MYLTFRHSIFKKFLSMLGYKGFFALANSKSRFVFNSSASKKRQVSIWAMSPSNTGTHFCKIEESTKKTLYFGTTYSYFLLPTC